MIKVSSQQLQEVLQQGAETIRHLSAENQTLKEKVASHDRQIRVEKIASDMEAKRLDPESTYAEKVAKLLQRSNLDAVEEAVGLAAQQVKLASLSDDPGNGDISNAAGRFIAGLLE